jgi:hypothetical protein
MTPASKTHIVVMPSGNTFREKKRDYCFVQSIIWLKEEHRYMPLPNYGSMWMPDEFDVL